MGFRYRSPKIFQETQKGSRKPASQMATFHMNGGPQIQFWAMSYKCAQSSYLVLHNIVTFLKSYATLRLWETRQGYGVIFKS